MLFDQKEFEHKIEENKLKQGLKLFVKNKVELLNKKGNSELTFFIHSKILGEINIRLKGEKILDYKCCCANENYCEHLAAAIFYLQQTVFEINKLKVTNSKKLKGDSKKIKNIKSELFEKYLNRIKTIIKPYLFFQKSKSTQLNEIYKKINSERSGAEIFGHDFYFNLAILTEITKLPIFTFENQLTQLVNNSTKELEVKFSKGLSVAETDGFLAATYYSVRSQPNFRAGAYAFLISRAAVLIKKISDFENLRTLLKKRKLAKNKLDTVDNKIITEIQLLQMEARLLEKQISFKNYEDIIELPIALAELEFLNNKIVKGFQILEAEALKIKLKNINRYLDFIDKTIIFAKKYNNEKKELEYLIEKFSCGYFIDQNEFNRFTMLIPSSKGGFGVNELLEKIKKESILYTFEKTALILLNQNRLDELITEIKKEKNKFKLLNEIGIKKLPQHSPEFITLYIKHFTNAVADAKFPYFQQQLFDLAKTYLDGLPSEIREKTIETIKEKMIYEKHMVAYITKLYALQV